MLAGTFLGIFFIPVFFVTVQRIFHSLPDEPAHAAAPTAPATPVPPGVPAAAPRSPPLPSGGGGPP
jgi:hypothetical protein